MVMELVAQYSWIIGLIITILAGAVGMWARKQTGLTRHFAELLSEALVEGANQVKKLKDNPSAVKYMKKKGLVHPEIKTKSKE